MEIQFIKNTLQCMRPFFSQVQTQEQTQEVRLPDAYPDIGKVLSCWGQVMIRGKEWRSTSMGANGGVMVWVLYAPEDGTQLRVVDVWVPFQCRWDFPEATEDGTILLCPVLSELDSRGISARKIMVRAVVSVCGDAMTKWKAETASAPEMPGDVQLLSKSYPMELPVEAGEKQVTLEENMSLPNDSAKIMGYALSPMILEQKVLGNRMVFRGTATLSVTYMTEDGQIKHWDSEIPFSQYTELDKDYPPTASAWILPVTTALELETMDDGSVQMHAGVAAQYVIYDRAVVDVVEDAFSPIRDVHMKTDEVLLPSLLDTMTLDMVAEGKAEGELADILAINAVQEYPELLMGEHGMQVSIDGQFQGLCKDIDGQIYADFAAFKCKKAFESDPENQVHLWPGLPMEHETLLGGDSVTLRCHYPVTAQVYSGQKIPMVSELELGERKEPDPNRPSIILKRAGEEGIWPIAKSCGSTVAAIRQANHLEGEPQKGQMLLIPIS